VILDRKGNIFGGFTPVKWESGHGFSKTDNSLQSFLFTLKNPHNLPARRFELKATEKHRAIGCGFTYSPWFNGAIRVKDDCDSRADNSGHIGNFYINDAGLDDTGLDDETLFTGSLRFQVQEIEVFEMTD
jgi:hypothetical protein